MTLQTLPTKVPWVACYDPQRCYEFVNFEANKMLVEIQGAPLTQNKWNANELDIIVRKNRKVNIRFSVLD